MPIVPNDPSPASPQPIAYTTAARVPRRWFSLRSVLFALLVTGLVQISLLLPFQLKPLFLQFHLKLPVLTQVWLDIGDWWNEEYGWAIVLPLSFGASVGVTLLRGRALPGNGRIKWLLFANLVFLAFNVIFVLTALAAYLPMIRLIEDMSNSGRK
jgi:hypothetical protein